MLLIVHYSLPRIGEKGLLESGVDYNLTAV